jgi:CheY-like chemotaxis protein/anti-sigma regulatory factor (Ser/Thr protein kinase)
MALIGEWFRRLGYLLRRRKLEDELRREMEAHRAEMGEPPAFGNTLRLREEARDAWGWRWLDDLVHDTRFAWRTLRHSPGFALTAIVTLALGIGVNIGMFTLINGLLLRPLYPGAKDVFGVHSRSTAPSGRNRAFSYPNYRDIRDGTTDIFADLAASSTGFVGLDVGDGPRSTYGYVVTANYFQVFAAPPAHGRAFTAEEEQPGAGIRVAIISYSTEPVTLYGDAVRLTQVLANLLTNAAKYTNAGGHIWIEVRKNGDRAIVSVRDNGIGIAADQLASVFDMFTQVDRSSRRAQGGLGIGLTLVRSLVAQHGGRVEARSEGLGSGSEFVVELPVVAVAGRVLPSDESKTARTLPRRRILVVDDNCDAAESLGELLSALGATVCVVHRGREALDTLDSFAPDSVLLDIGMPDMDGYEVARKIRSTAEHGDVLLIALTGWGQEHDQRRALAAGFDHHVVKPPDIDKLRDLLTTGWSDAGTHSVASRDGIDKSHARNIID